MSNVQALVQFPRTGLGASATFCDTAAGNQSIIEDLFRDQLKRIRLLFDISVEIAVQHIGGLDTLVPRTDAQRSAYHLFQKQAHAQFDALTLVTSGAFGSARILLRQVLEAQMIAKFCCLSEDEQLALRWQAGKSVKLGSVFNNVRDTDMSPIKVFWGELCQFTHATIYAQQGTRSIEGDVELDQVELTLVFIEMLGECGYHLLNTHLLGRSARYYAATYGKRYTAPQLRTEARDVFRDAHKMYGPSAKAVIRSFKRQWNIKPVTSRVVVRTPLSFRQDSPSRANVRTRGLNDR